MHVSRDLRTQKAFFNSGEVPGQKHNAFNKISVTSSAILTMFTKSLYQNLSKFSAGLEVL
jgi:hypothetical protein